MKKLFTTLFIVLGFYTFSRAQQEAGGFEFGFNAGFNYSYVTATNGFQDSGLKSGFTAGVSADYYFSESWSLKARVSYDQKGWGNGYVSTTDDQGNTAETDGVNIKLNYITIPVMANFHFGRDREWYFDFGPYVGLLTSASGAGYDLKSTFNSTDGGIDAGVGIKFPLSDRAKFFVEIDGQAGVVNIAGNNEDSGDNGSLTNERTSINVGINF